jgi:hypothetical protein
MKCNYNSNKLGQKNVRSANPRTRSSSPVAARHIARQLGDGRRGQLVLQRLLGRLDPRLEHGLNVPPDQALRVGRPVHRDHVRVLAHGPIYVEQRDGVRRPRQKRAATGAHLRRREPRSGELREEPPDERWVRVHASRDQLGRRRFPALRLQEGEDVHGDGEASVHWGGCMACVSTLVTHCHRRKGGPSDSESVDLRSFDGRMGIDWSVVIEPKQSPVVKKLDELNERFSHRGISRAEILVRMARAGESHPEREIVSKAMSS